MLGIYVAKWTNVTESGEKCFDLDESQKKLDRETYYFSYSIDNSKIDHHNHGAPLEKIPFNNRIIVTTTVSYDYSMFYKHVDYNSDRGWIISTWNNSIGYQFDESLTEKIIHTNDPPYIYDNTLGSYKFRLSPSIINKYERKYPNFPTMIANISAFSKVVLTIGQLFARLFSTAYYYVNLITLLSVNGPMSSKKQSLKNISEFKTSKSKASIDIMTKVKMNPCISSIWMVCPR